jgi:hypothetical protein
MGITTIVVLNHGPKAAAGATFDQTTMVGAEADERCFSAFGG